MGIVNILINIPGQKIINKNSDINSYFHNEAELISQIATKGGRLRVFFDGWFEVKAYPEKIIPVPNDRILSVVLDKGDEKKSFELYETEFELISEIWREKKWGFSAVDLLGNTVALMEYDYVYKLQKSGCKVYDAGSNRRIYNIDHDKQIGNRQKFFKEFSDGLKNDFGWLFSFFKKNRGQ